MSDTPIYDRLMWELDPARGLDAESTPIYDALADDVTGFRGWRHWYTPWPEEPGFCLRCGDGAADLVHMDWEQHEEVAPSSDPVGATAFAEQRLMDLQRGILLREAERFQGWASRFEQAGAQAKRDGARDKALEFGRRAGDMHAVVRALRSKAGDWHMGQYGNSYINRRRPIRRRQWAS